MHVKANSKQVVEMTMSLTLHGAWTAFLQVDSTVALDSAITLTIGDVLEFLGTADRTGQHLGRAKLRVMGGAGGFTTVATGKTYYRAPLRAILGDLLSVAGETLSSLSDATLLATAPKHWARAAGSVRDEIDVLAERFGFNWRVLPNGETWFGSETWDASSLVNYQLLRDEHEDNLVELAAELPAVLPGETFLERHVSEVEHTLGRGGLRTVVRFE